MNVIPVAGKVEKLKKQEAAVRIGGKGSMRRKKKAGRHIPNVVDEKPLQAACKKINCAQVPSVDSVTMFNEDGTVLRFSSPKVQIAFTANTYAVTGNAETKPLSEVFTKLIHEMGPEQFKAFCAANGGLDGAASLARRKLSGLGRRGRLRSRREQEKAGGGQDNKNEKGDVPAGNDGDDQEESDDDDDEEEEEIPTLVKNFEAASVNEK